ncbi:hypothetical protein IAT40_001667 [Kwoniella sp. CBS 6097]
MSLVYQKELSENPTKVNKRGERALQIDSYLEQRRLNDDIMTAIKKSHMLHEALAKEMDRGRFDLGLSQEDGPEPPEHLTLQYDDSSIKGYTPDTTLGLPQSASAARSGIECVNGVSQTDGSHRSQTRSRSRSQLAKVTLDQANLLALANGLGSNTGEQFRPSESTAEQLKAYTHSLHKLRDIMSQGDYRYLYSKQSCMQPAQGGGSAEGATETDFPVKNLERTGRAIKSLRPATERKQKEEEDEDEDETKKETGADISGKKAWEESYPSYKSTHDQVEAILKDLDPDPMEEERRQVNELSRRYSQWLYAHPDTAEQVSEAQATLLIGRRGERLDWSGQTVFFTALGDLWQLNGYTAVTDLLSKAVYTSSKHELEDHKPLSTLCLTKGRHPDPSIQLLSEIDQATELSQRLYTTWREEQTESLRRHSKDTAERLSDLVGLLETDAEGVPTLPNHHEFTKRLKSASDISQAQAGDASRLHALASTRLKKCNGYAEMFEDYSQSLGRVITDWRTVLNNLQTQYSEDPQGQTAIAAFQAKIDLIEAQSQQIMLEHQRSSRYSAAVFNGETVGESHSQALLSSQVREQMELDSRRRDAETRLTESMAAKRDSDFRNDITIEEVQRRLHTRSQLASTSNRSQPTISKHPEYAAQISGL